MPKKTEQNQRQKAKVKRQKEGALRGLLINKKLGSHPAVSVDCQAKSPATVYMMCERMPGGESQSEEITMLRVGIPRKPRLRQRRFVDFAGFRHTEPNLAVPYRHAVWNLYQAIYLGRVRR